MPRNICYQAANYLPVSILLLRDKYSQLTAMVMYDQHLLQILAPEQHVRTSS